MLVMVSLPWMAWRKAQRRAQMEEDMYPKKTIMDDKTLQELVNTISFDIDTKMLTTISKLSALHNVDYDIGEDMAKKKEQIDELWKITGNPLQTTRTTHPYSQPKQKDGAGVF